MINKIARRLHSMLGIGRSTTASQEGATPTVQLSFIGTSEAGPEIRDGMAVVQTYGFASATLPGCDYVAGFLSGDRAKGVAVASNDRRYRPTGLQPGEAVVYDNQGQQVYLSASGVAVTSSKQITLSAGGHSIIISSAGVVIDGFNFANHTHTSETVGTPTSAPNAGT